MEIEYKSEYKTFVNDAILSYLNSYTSDNEEKGFLSLMYYIAKNHRSKIQDIKYYIREAFINYSPNGLDNILKCIFSEMIKDLLNNKFNEICNFVDYSILYTNSKFELFIEFYTDTRLMEGKEFFDNLKQLIPDIIIYRTVNGELRD